MKLLVPSFLLLFAMGCQSSDTGVGDLSSDVLVRSYLAPEDRPTTPDERRALSVASRSALQQTRQILKSSASWQEADQRLRKAIDAERDPLLRRHLEETAAVKMLNPAILGSLNTSASKEATGYYVEALVRHRSPETPLLADAIGRLDGYWSPNEVARVAAKALDAAEAFAERGADCEDCRREQAETFGGASPSQAASISGPQAAYETQLPAAVRRLRLLSDATG